MATKEQLEKALINADKAGDTQAATVLANELKKLNKPSTEDEVKSYASSAWEGLKSLPTGAFQLGANLGDKANWTIDSLLGRGDLYGDGIELTDTAKQRAKEAGIKVPESTPRTFGQHVNKTVQDQRAEKEALRKKAGRDGFDWVELAGMMANPVNYINPGVGAIPKVTDALSKKTLYGGKVGTAYGSLMPVTNGDHWEKKAEQTAVGGGFGAALPVGVALTKGTIGVADELTKPLYKKGIQRDVEKFVRNLFQDDPTGSKAKTALALANAKNGETAGMAIARANRANRGDSFGSDIVRLEKDMTKRSDPLRIVKEILSNKREGVIERIAKTPADINAAKAARSAQQGAKYQEAFGNAIKADPELARIAQNPYFKDALPKALKNAEAKGINPKDNLTEFLHSIKTSLDKELTKGGDDALDKTGRKIVKDLKNDLVAWLGNKNPAYEEARAGFAQASKPINRMEVGQVLKNALTSPQEVERAASFTNAVREAPRTIKSGTGQSIYNDLGQVLTPGQNRGVKAVTESLLNQSKFNQMAKDTVSKIGELASEAKLDLPTLLSRPVVAANFALKKIGLDKQPEYRRVMVELLTDPKRMAKILEEPKQSKTKQIAMEIMQAMSSQVPAKSVGETNGL